jgi:hypothetical protein
MEHRLDGNFHCHHFSKTAVEEARALRGVGCEEKMEMWKRPRRVFRRDEAVASQGMSWRETYDISEFLELPI